MTDNETINNMIRHLGVSRVASGSNEDEGKRFQVLHFYWIYSCKLIVKCTNELTMRFSSSSRWRYTEESRR